MDRTTPAYAQAFDLYLRKGIRPDLSVKKRTGYYVWRTRNDGKVRPEHAANNGKVFSWDDPPPTGHPGKDYNCRCRAEPLSASAGERYDHRFIVKADSGVRWTSFDFVKHFYFGAGRSVQLSQIGHLGEVSRMIETVHDVPWKLANQIAKFARGKGEGRFLYDFSKPYDFRSLAWVHGDATVSGYFDGIKSSDGPYFTVSGHIFYDFFDVFTDPTDLMAFARVERPEELPLIVRMQTDLNGRAFLIFGSWYAKYSARYFVEKSASRFN